MNKNFLLLFVMISNAFLTHAIYEQKTLGQMMHHVMSEEEKRQAKIKVNKSGLHSHEVRTRLIPAG